MWVLGREHLSGWLRDPHISHRKRARCRCSSVAQIRRSASARTDSAGSASCRAPRSAADRWPEGVWRLAGTSSFRQFHFYYVHPRLCAGLIFPRPLHYLDPDYRTKSFTTALQLPPNVRYHFEGNTQPMYTQIIITLICLFWGPLRRGVYASEIRSKPG